MGDYLKAIRAASWGAMTKLVMMPGPTNVSARVIEAMSRAITDYRTDEFRRLYRGIIEKLKKVYFTDGYPLVLTSSGTGGIEAAATNIVRKDDNVICLVCGFFSSCMAESMELAGANVVTLGSDPGDTPRMAEIERAFERTKDVKALSIVYNETSTGVTFRWLKEAGRLAAERGALLIVDAVSIFAGDEFPVDEWGVDISVTGSQKCLALPPGLALLSISKKAREYIEANPIQARYLNLARYLKLADEGDVPWTPAISLFYGLDESLSMILEEGLLNRFRRHRACARAFYSTFQAMGLEPLAKEDVRSNTTVAIKYPAGIDDKQFRSALYQSRGIVIAGGAGELRGRIFRVGSMGEINSLYVRETVEAISDVLNRMGFANDQRRALEAADQELALLMGI